MITEYLDAMAVPGRAVSFDTETHLIQPGLRYPPLVCASIAELLPDGRIAGELLDKPGARRAFESILADDSLIMVCANGAFDLGVMAVDAARRGLDLMPAIFRALALGRVFDVQLAEAEHHIGIGSLGRDPRTGAKLRDPETNEICRYRLSVVVDLVLGRVDAKRNDAWRERYAELEPYPIETWPPEARQYPIDDAVNTLEAALAQAGHRPSVGAHVWPNMVGPDGRVRCQQCAAAVDEVQTRKCVSTYRRMNLHDLAIQVFKAFALDLGAAWGMRTDPIATEFLLATVAESRAEVLDQFIRVGYVRNDEDFSEDTGVVKRAVALAYGADPLGQCPAAGCEGGRIYERSKRDPTKRVGKGKGCLVCNATGLELRYQGSVIPLTEPSEKFPHGQVQSGRDVLVESGDSVLMDYAGTKEVAKIENTYGPWLLDATTRPSSPKPNALVETGRTSYSGKDQTLPRQVPARLAARLKKRRQDMRDMGLDAPLVVGVRDCVVPRDGYVFYSVDYEGGELVTHAESCVKLIGYSKMGEALIKGVNVHGALGATMLGLGYDDFMARMKSKENAVEAVRCKLFRQAAKPGNFGFPGRMGAAKLVLQQRKQGPDTPHPSGPSEVWDDGAAAFTLGYKGTRFCVMIGGAERCGEIRVTEWNRQPIPATCKRCIECAENIKAAWMKQWPENGPYLKRIVPAAEEQGYVVQHYSGRIRGGVDGGSIANGWFQALLADVIARAACRVAYEQYADPSSVLYGVSRNVLLLHDELFGEVREDVAHECVKRIEEIMVEEFRRACPHHAAACKAEAAIARRWYKAMAPVYDKTGRLIPWEPKA